MLRLRSLPLARRLSGIRFPGLFPALFPAIAAAILASLTVTGLPSPARAAACSPDLYRVLTADHPRGVTPVEINCDLSLSASDKVTVPIAYSGAGAPA